MCDPAGFSKRLGSQGISLVFFKAPNELYPLTWNRLIAYQLHNIPGTRVRKADQLVPTAP
jgi:hypothetical protein